MKTVRLTRLNDSECIHVQIADADVERFEELPPNVHEDFQVTVADPKRAPAIYVAFNYAACGMTGIATIVTPDLPPTGDLQPTDDLQLNIPWPDTTVTVRFCMGKVRPQLVPLQRE